MTIDRSLMLHVHTNLNTLYDLLSVPCLPVWQNLALDKALANATVFGVDSSLEMELERGSLAQHSEETSGTQSYWWSGTEGGTLKSTSCTFHLQRYLLLYIFCTSQFDLGWTRILRAVQDVGVDQDFTLEYTTVQSSLWVMQGQTVAVQVWVRECLC